MDNKLSPVKESLSQDSTDVEEDHDVLESIKEEAPGWFAKAFSFLMAELNTIKMTLVIMKLNEVKSEKKYTTWISPQD